VNLHLYLLLLSKVIHPDIHLESTVISSLSKALKYCLYESKECSVLYITKLIQLLVVVVVNNINYLCLLPSAPPFSVLMSLKSFFLSGQILMGLNRRKYDLPF